MNFIVCDTSLKRLKNVSLGWFLRQRTFISKTRYFISGSNFLPCPLRWSCPYCKSLRKVAINFRRAIGWTGRDTMACIWWLILQLCKSFQGLEWQVSWAEWWGGHLFWAPLPDTMGRRLSSWLRGRPGRSHYEMPSHSLGFVSGAAPCCSLCYLPTTASRYNSSAIATSQKPKKNLPC